MNTNRRNLLKLIGLGAASTATSVVASTINQNITLSDNLEDKTITIDGVKTLDVKETTLYKKFLENTMLIIEEIAENIEEANDFFDEDLDFERLSFYKETNFEIDFNVKILDDIPNDTLVKSLRVLEYMDDMACGGSFDMGGFKSTWMTGIHSLESTELLLSDFDDEVPENILKFYSESEQFTSNHQSEDFNI